MKKVCVLLSVIFAVILCTSCSVDVKSSQNSSKGKGKKGKVTAKHKKGSKEKTDAIPVQVISPAKGDISSFMLFSSNVDTDKKVDIYPMTSGIIEKILKDEGDRVKRGEALALLDRREAGINEEKARINYNQLKDEFQRQKEIFEKKLISKEAYEKLKYSMLQAKLDWKQKKLLLSYTEITSPITGVVSKRHIKVGNKINTSQLSFSVVSDTEKLAVVNIPELEKKNIYKGQEVVAFSGDLNAKGRVLRVSPSIDPESGTFKVTVKINDADSDFAVGQFVNVKIIKKVHKDAVLLPKDALIFEGGNVFLFEVTDKDKAVKTRVATGFEEGNSVEILKGVDLKARVVTAGKSSLKNGALVKIIEPVESK